LPVGSSARTTPVPEKFTQNSAFVSKLPHARGNPVTPF
jgi:hypothetical protein